MQKIQNSNDQKDEVILSLCYELNKLLKTFTGFFKDLNKVFFDGISPSSVITSFMPVSKIAEIVKKRGQLFNEKHFAKLNHLPKQETDLYECFSDCTDFGIMNEIEKLHIMFTNYMSDENETKFMTLLSIEETKYMKIFLDGIMFFQTKLDVFETKKVENVDKYLLKVSLWSAKKFKEEMDNDENSDYMIFVN